MPRRRKLEKRLGAPPKPKSMPTSSAKDGAWDREAEEALREAIIWAAERHAAQSPMRIGVHEKLAGLKISGPKNNQERRKRMAQLSLDGINWKQVAERMRCETRYTAAQCKKYWTEELHKKSVKGAWSTPEDNLLNSLIQVLGPAYWSRLSTLIPGRSGKQCRERWLNHLDPTLKKGPWSEAEIQCLIENQRRFNNCWSKIAKCIPGRSENSVKNQWNSIMHRTYTNQLKEDVVGGTYRGLKLQIPGKQKSNTKFTPHASPIRAKPVHAFGDLRRPKSASPSKADQTNRVVMVPRLPKSESTMLDRMFGSLAPNLRRTRRHEVNVWRREPESSSDAPVMAPDANGTSRARYRPASTPRTDSKKRLRRAGTTPKNIGVRRSLLNLKNEPAAFSYRADEEGRTLEITNSFMDKELRRARLFDRMKIDVSKGPARTPAISPMTSAKAKGGVATETAKAKRYFASVHDIAAEVSTSDSPKPWFCDSRFYFNSSVDKGVTASPRPWFKDKRFADATTPASRQHKEVNLDQSLQDIAITHGAALPDGGGDEEPVMADDDDNWFQNMLLNAPSPRPHDYSLALAGDRAGDGVEGEGNVERLVTDLNASFDVADFLGEEHLDEDELSLPFAYPSSSDAEPVARLQAASAAVEMSALTPTARALYHINSCFDNGNITQDEKFKRKADLVGRQRSSSVASAASASASRIRTFSSTGSGSSLLSVPHTYLRLEGDDDPLANSFDDLPSM